jgi:hypothetical protein
LHWTWVLECIQWCYFQSHFEQGQVVRFLSLCGFRRYKNSELWQMLLSNISRYSKWYICYNRSPWITPHKGIMWGCGGPDPPKVCVLEKSWMWYKNSCIDDIQPAIESCQWASWGVDS